MTDDAAPDFDVLVLGGGSAGIAGASIAGIFGRRAAIVEPQPKVGGAGLISGTVPSKTLRETAVALAGMRARTLLGVELSLRREATIAELTSAEQKVSGAECRRAEALLKRLAVETIRGTASFVDPHTVNIVSPDAPDRQVRANVILIATGSSPVRPPEFQFEDDRVHDSDELLNLQALPKRLVVVGAGVIGSEYACTFSVLGCEVHVVDGRGSLMPFLDGDIAHALLAAMTGHGIVFHWNETVTRCDVSDPQQLVLTLASGTTIECDGVLVCAGRASNTAGLNLAAAGLSPGPRGAIPVDSHFQTSVPHIYAAGDVAGPPALASTGMEQGRIAICHALGVTAKADMSQLLPTGIYTIPEAAMVGATEESLHAAGVSFIAGRARYRASPRGQLIGDDTGLLKLLFRSEDLRLLGVHVVGEQATELVHIGMTAMLAEAGADLFNRACFNFPTLGELYKYAAYDAILKRQGIAAAHHDDDHSAA